MNQPPPGWHQQPQQQGWPQPPQQGGYPPPGYPPQQQPPRKSKAPMVIAVIVGLVVVLSGLAAGLVTYLDIHKDGGEPKRANALPSLCGNISEPALAKARTTNPNALGSHESEMSGTKSTTCSWNQTKGVDGQGYRSVDVYVARGEKDIDFDRIVAQHMDTGGTPQQKPLDGLGDQAAAVLVEGNSALTDIWILVRKGDATVKVDYAGWDAGFMSHTKPDVAEFEGAATTLAKEMVAKI